MTRPTRRQQDALRQEVERLLLVHTALDLEHRAACRDLKACRHALRRERVARWEAERELAAIVASRGPVDRTLLLRLAGEMAMSDWGLRDAE